MSSSVAEAVTKERLHSSGEDYLKSIFILEAQHGSVRSVEVAEYMNVSKASVNHAVRHTRNQAHYLNIIRLSTHPGRSIHSNTPCQNHTKILPYIW